MSKKFVLSLLLTFGFLILSYSGVSAATFEFSPATYTFKKECESSINIIADTKGAESNAADIEIRYDITKIDIIDSNPNSPGTQIDISSADAYEVYVYNLADETTGVIRVAATNFMSNLNGRKTFGTIEFKTLPGVSTANFTIYFTSPNNSLDSNIADAYTSLDLLTSVTNGSYTFVDGSCIEDTQAPPITFIDPRNNQTGVPLDTNIQIRITDNLSGVDLSNTIIEVDGIEYRLGDPGFSYTGDLLNYLITINPTTPLTADQTIIVTVRTVDNAGNTSNRSMAFNQPYVPPVIYKTCGETCDIENPCANPYQCESGLCRLPSCVMYGDENCTCDPPPYVDSCDTETIIQEIPVVQTITKFLESTGIPQVINNIVPQEIKDLAQLVSLPGLTSGLLSLTYLTNAIMFLTALRSPGVIFAWLIGLFKKTRNPWGIVFDIETKEPIPYAVVRAYLKGTKTIVEQRVTDENGRYGLLLPSGDYRLEVEHPDYEKSSFDVLISNDNDVVPKDFPMSTEESITKEGFSLRIFFKRINVFINKTSLYINSIGLILSILAVIIRPNLFNFIMLILYTVLLYVYLRNRRLKVKRWGVVLDSQTNLRIPYAIVKLFDRESMKLLDTQMTNSQGAFGLFNEPGQYAISASVNGYRFPSKLQRGLARIPGNDDVLQLEKKKKKDLKVKLLMDPVSNTLTGSNTENAGNKKGEINSPFGN